jgi:hypothetical protein
MLVVFLTGRGYMTIGPTAWVWDARWVWGWGGEAVVRWFLVVLTGYASKGARWWAFAGCRLQVAGVRTLSMYAPVDYRSGRSELGQRFEPELQVREPNGTGSNRFKDGSHGH